MIWFAVLAATELFRSLRLFDESVGQGEPGRRLGFEDGDDFYRSRIRERGEHLRGSLPDVAEALGKELGISIPQLDVVASGRARFESDGVATDERGSLGFGFPDSARGPPASLVPVKEFMRQFMCER